MRVHKTMNFTRKHNQNKFLVKFSSFQWNLTYLSVFKCGDMVTELVHCQCAKHHVTFRPAIVSLMMIEFD